MGGISKKNRVFVANISDECIIGEYMGKCCQGVLNMWRGGGTLFISHVGKNNGQEVYSSSG